MAKTDLQSFAWSDASTDSNKNTKSRKPRKLRPLFKIRTSDDSDSTQDSNLTIISDTTLTPESDTITVSEEGCFLGLILTKILKEYFSKKFSENIIQSIASLK